MNACMIEYYVIEYVVWIVKSHHFFLLFYSRMYPPHSLISKTSSNSTMLKDSPPSWAMVSSAPTDWALLQQAKELRKGKTLVHDKDTYYSRSAFPLANAALGLPPMPSRKRRNAIVFLVVVVLAAAVASFGNFASVGWMSRTKVPLMETAKPSLWERTLNGGTNRKSTRKSMTTRAKKSRTPRESRHDVVVVVPQTIVSKNLSTTTKFNHEKTRKVSTVETKTTLKVSKLVTAVKEWKREHFNKEKLSRLATRAIVESDKLRWKGQRFLL